MSGMPCLAAATKSSAEYAYLQIFDANDLKERRILLSHILTDPKTSLMFLLHCRPDVSEYELAFKQIVHDPNLCSELLSKKSEELPASMRARALTTVEQDPSLSWSTAWSARLTTEEKRRIYELHKGHFLETKTLDNYWAQWGCFGDVMHQDELAQLVELTYDADSYEAWDIAETLLNYAKLTPDQRDRLESKQLANKLRHGP